MAHRVFRFSVSPEAAPDVRRVLELDGKATLSQLHEAIGRAYDIPLSRAGYVFFLSGRFWDGASMFVDPRADGRRADKAVLFRLGLEPGRHIAYVLGFEVERHFVAELLSVADAERPLGAPVLVEAVGDAPREPMTEEPSEREPDPPGLERAVELAERFLDRDDELEQFEDALSAARARIEPWTDGLRSLEDLAAFKASAGQPDSELLRDAQPAFRAAAAAALELVHGLAGNLETFHELDEWLLERALAVRLLGLPLSLTLVQEFDTALELARALEFIDPETVNGDVAVILARAGQREAALAQVERNLATARDAALAEACAGDAHRALGDGPAAEAYYRASLAAAKTWTERLHALLRLVTCLTDAGRDAEASELLKDAQRLRGEPKPAAEPASSLSAVGRNDPCPCGSGKKYKKCHGL